MEGMSFDLPANALEALMRYHSRLCDWFSTAFLIANFNISASERCGFTPRISCTHRGQLDMVTTSHMVTTGDMVTIGNTMTTGELVTIGDMMTTGDMVTKGNMVTTGDTVTT